MEEKLSVSLGSGWKLCAEHGVEPYDREIYVFIEDPNGVIWQDLAVVRNVYGYASGSDPIYMPGLFDVLIYGDAGSEDYTVSYRVPLYQAEADTDEPATYDSAYPCSGCFYDPPSSGDGKPCTMCDGENCRMEAPK